MWLRLYVNYSDLDSTSHELVAYKVGILDHNRRVGNRAGREERTEIGDGHFVQGYACTCVVNLTVFWRLFTTFVADRRILE